LAGIEAVPANYLVQILSELRNGGLITSRRGKQGGYMLARGILALRESYLTGLDKAAQLGPDADSHD
jgi:hypothetical protein